MKKILLLTSLCLCFYVQAFHLNGIDYSINTGETEVTVTGRFLNNDTNLIILNTVLYRGTEYKVTSIGYGAFNNTNIKHITIGENVETIKDKAFYNNGSLTSVIIGKNVKTIGYNAFGSCKLTNVTIPDKVISIGIDAFYYNRLTNVVIGNSVTVIKKRAFQSNKLTNIIIPDNVTSIGESAFSHNDLTSVTISKNLKVIEESTFLYNELTSVIIPENVTTIGDGAFQNNKLTSITLGNNVRRIDDYAFWNNDLERVVVNNSTPVDITTSVFTYNGDLSLIALDVPHGSEALYASKDIWKEFNIKIILNTNNTDFLKNVKIYPNPTIGLINVTVEGVNDGIIKVLTSSGIFVQEEIISDGKAQFNINGEKGLYLIEVIAANKKRIFKVIK